jgi:hypothetical protein
VPLVSLRLKVSACCGMPYTCSTPDRWNSLMRILYSVNLRIRIRLSLIDQDSHLAIRIRIKKLYEIRKNEHILEQILIPITFLTWFCTYGTFACFKKYLKHKKRSKFEIRKSEMQTFYFQCDKQARIQRRIQLRSRIKVNCRSAYALR